MFHLFRKLREPFRGILLGIGTILTLAASYTWPHLAVFIWGLLIVTAAALIYADLKEPVNYESLHIADGVITYVSLGQTKTLKLDQITKLEFVKDEALFPDLYGPYLESKWFAVRPDSSYMEIMDEWPHRKALLVAFREHLPRFDDTAAQQGLNARCEGRWICYDANSSIASPTPAGS